MTLMCTDYIHDILRQCVTHNAEIVQIDKSVLMSVLSELLLLHSHIRADDANRIGAVRDMAMQASMVWAMKLCRDMLESDQIPDVGADGMLTILHDRFEEINAAIAGNSLMSGNA